MEGKVTYSAYEGVYMEIFILVTYIFTGTNDGKTTDRGLNYKNHEV
jgi:hypothetical protein